MKDREIEQLFISNGGYFHTPIRLIKEQIKNIKAYLFDWRGVFNSGFLPSAGGSYEQDAFGLNLLRYSHYLATGEVPFVAIISETELPEVWTFCREGNLSALYHSIEHKDLALKHIGKQLDINNYHMSLTFDDASDLPSAKQCGLRFLVQRKGSPLMYRYLKQRHWVDYVSAESGGGFAVREICELIGACHENSEELFDHIANHHESYQSFLKEIGKMRPVMFKQEGDQIATTH